jgi:chitin synthase
MASPLITPQQTTDLLYLLPTPSSPSTSRITTTDLPSDDTILSTLQSRSRSDLPYTYLGAKTLILVNPLRTLGNLSDSSALDYVGKYTQGVSSTAVLPGGKKGGKGKGKEDGLVLGVEQPHVYDLAGRVWTMMRRRREHQAVVFRWVCVMLSFGCCGLFWGMGS